MHKKIIIPGALCAFALLLGVLAYLQHGHTVRAILPTPSALSETAAAISGPQAAHESDTPESASSSASASSEASATLVVGTASYRIGVTEGETVLGAMEELRARGGFTYTSRDYPGLGTFIDSINGKMGGGGLYWILYVNGKSSDLGASAVIVKANDVIEWKYETAR